jgi:diguanylate cyclase (GGDEF)-like protein
MKRPGLVPGRDRFSISVKRTRQHFVLSFCWGVALAGAMTLAASLVHYGLGDLGTATVALLAVGVVLGELVPLKLPLGGGDEEVNLSTTFCLALLLSAGLTAALIVQAVASLLQDLVARKPLWRSAFNVGQYTLSLAAAGLLLDRYGIRGSVAIYGIAPAELSVVLLAGIAFYVVNTFVVGVAVAAYQGRAVLANLRSDLRMTMIMTATSLCLTPLVLVAVQGSPLLIALFVVPFVAVHLGGRQACASTHQAMHDGLTGLPNRTFFRRLVTDAIAHAKPGTRLVVMLLDLNRFKEINDTLGHHFGDMLLERTGPRLQGALRDGDLIARLGGDEFAVLLRNVEDDDAALAVADRLCRALQAPFELDGFALEVDASIGMASYPSHGQDVETLLRRADVAMYRAKERHIPHLAYTQQIDEHSPARLALVADLRRALEQDEIVVHYQPKLDLNTRRIVGLEALVRWQHPSLGLLQPAAFIDMAEQTGLIRPLTHAVLEQALRQCAACHAQGMDLTVAVNVSPRSLVDPRLVDNVEQSLRSCALPANRLTLEITETAIMIDPALALQVLNRLAALGVCLSIDDFGTGYSSLGYLQKLPVRELKIDRSFVLSMASSDPDAAIVSLSTDLGARLGLKVVAEGVEDHRTLDELTRLGCDQAQGYLISRPQPAHHIASWLRDNPTLFAESPGRATLRAVAG